MDILGPRMNIDWMAWETEDLPYVTRMSVTVLMAGEKIEGGSEVYIGEDGKVYPLPKDDTERSITLPS